jgi:hypothetical protein
MSVVVCATNCNRTYIAKDKSLGSNFYSSIADFKDMPMGSIQVVWSDVVGTFDGQIVLYCSNLHESDSLFDGGEIDGAIIPINSENGNCMWLRDRLAFRYLQARFTKNGIVSGTVDIIAYGKKS